MIKTLPMPLLFSYPLLQRGRPELLLRSGDEARTQPDATATSPGKHSLPPALLPSCGTWGHKHDPCTCVSV